MLNFKTSIFIITLLYVSLVPGLISGKNKSSSKATLDVRNIKSFNNNSKINVKNTKVVSKGKASMLKKLGLKTDRGFGFTGNCTYGFSSIVVSLLPDKVAKIFNSIVLPLVAKVFSLPQICYGDFTGNELKTNETFVNAQCSKLPLNSNHEFGVISFTANNVPCVKPVTVAACVVFDDEGTGAVVFNGDLLGCAVSLTGVGVVFQPFIKFIGAMGFGVSLNKKFEKKVDVCYNQNGDITCGEKLAKGHFLFVLNLSIPEFKIGGKDLKEYMKLDAMITYMIDLGGNNSFPNLSNSLFSETNTCSQQSNLVRTIRDVAAEFTMTIKGSLVLQLKKLSNGFLPNISLTLAEEVIIITKGQGNTGLNSGIYLHLKSNVVQSIYDVLKTFMDRYLSFFGVTMPIVDLSSLNSSLGLFIDSTMFGIQIELSGHELTCYFKFDSKKGSCKYNNSIFTAILEAAKWLIKHASVLFDEAGELFAEFGSNTVDFAKDASEAVANFTSSQYKYISREVTKIADSIANAGEQASAAALNNLIDSGTLIYNSYSEVFNQTNELANQAIDGLVGFAEDFGGDIEDVYGEAANFASSVSGSIVSGADSFTDGLESASNWIGSLGW